MEPWIGIPAWSLEDSKTCLRWRLYEKDDANVYGNTQSDVKNSAFWLNLTALQTKIDICANSVDPDVTTRKEPSHQDLTVYQSGFCFRLKPLFASVDVSKFKNGTAHFRNSGLKGLKMRLTFITIDILCRSSTAYKNLRNVLFQMFCNIL